MPLAVFVVMYLHRDQICVLVQKVDEYDAEHESCTFVSEVRQVMTCRLRISPLNH